MPSMEESRRQVKEHLDQSAKEVDHDAILASLQGEIDRHNALKDNLRSAVRSNRHRGTEERGERPIKFRFKSGLEEPKTQRKHHSRHHERDLNRHRRRRKEKHSVTQQESENENSAHPFPREPVEPLTPDVAPDEAFRNSLFDALADDEGAAYWESVYNQPIHIYPRPSVQTSQGKLEAMSDEEYVDYVKTKMWERKHPEIVFERKRQERERKLEEEEKARRREEFVRRREQAAWERAQRPRFQHDDEDDGPEYEFTGASNLAPSERQREKQEYAAAWAHYLSAWDTLKYDLLSERSGTSESTIEPKNRIPWPVLSSKPVIKANIEQFMHHAPTDDQHPRSQVLKAERVRWHPDKVQQRFGGAVDEGTMKIVTGIFQVVDEIANN